MNKTRLAKLRSRINAIEKELSRRERNAELPNNKEIIRLLNEEVKVINWSLSNL